MSAASATSLLVRKEIRALLPIWLASAATLVIGGFTGSTPFAVIAVGAYLLGAMALGALSVGHEYVHGTLGQLLAQPQDRRRLLAIKQGVLVLALGTLLALAQGVLAYGTSGDPMRAAALRTPAAWALLLLPVLAALTVAPWLTMLCRSPIAGVVFTAAVPAALWGGAELVTAWRNRLEGNTDVRIALDVVWIGTAIVAVLAAALGRRLFVRLESIDGHDEFEAPAWFGQTVLAARSGARARGRRRPLGMLLHKELRLQSATFVVAAMFVLAWVLTWISTDRAYRAASVLGGVTVLFTALIPGFVGALTSAEERAFGTIGWQVLQPYAAWKQWSVKVTFAIALSIVLAVALPSALELLMPFAGGPVGGAYREWLSVGQELYWSAQTPLMRRLYEFPWLPALTAIGLLAIVTLCGMYVSTLARGGLKAALLALPFVAAAGALHAIVEDTVRSQLFGTLRINALARASAANGGAPAWTYETIRWWSPQGAGDDIVRAALAAGFCGVLIVMAFRNHRTAGRTPRTVARQLAWVAAYVLIASAIGGAASPVALWALAH